MEYSGNGSPWSDSKHKYHIGKIINKYLILEILSYFKITRYEVEEFLAQTSLGMKWMCIKNLEFIQDIFYNSA